MTTMHCPSRDLHSWHATGTQVRNASDSGAGSCTRTPMHAAANPVGAYATEATFTGVPCRAAETSTSQPILPCHERVQSTYTARAPIQELGTGSSCAPQYSPRFSVVVESCVVFPSAFAFSRACSCSHACVVSWQKRL
jgi:hypothetical protein